LFCVVIYNERVNSTIFLVEDDADIADLMRHHLTAAGFAVRGYTAASHVLGDAERNPPALFLLDVMVPGGDGFDVCGRIRQHSKLAAIPIIFVTAKTAEADRVAGLELGADDYITKPFSPKELVARVKAVLRRTDGMPGAALIQVGGVVVDLGRREIRVDGTPIDFTTKEFELLRFLAERPGLAMSRHQILDAVWGHGWYGDERTVDVHIAQVRKKIGDACVIATVRGVGYRLEPAET